MTTSLLRRAYHDALYRVIGRELEVDTDREGKPVDHRLREQTHDLKNAVMAQEGSCRMIRQETSAFLALVEALRQEARNQ